MTEQEQEKASIDPELLPEEERDLYLHQLGRKDWTEEEKAMTEGVIKQDLEQPATDNALDTLNQEALKSYRHYSQFDTYSIEMRDNTTQRYRRMSIPALELEEIEDLRAEIESGMEINSGKPLNRIEVRQREKLLMKKKAEYYLFNLKTKKPMTPTELNNVKHAYVINEILNSCLLRSKSDAPEGKK